MSNSTSEKRKLVTIYTDGACSGNPGKGGWAALLEFGLHAKIISGRSEYTTNNIMELTAAQEALAALKSSCEVELLTDSKYLQEGLTKWLVGWKKTNWRTADNKPVKNQEIWEALDKLMQKHIVRVHWVKAHNGNEKNELVDQIARGEILKSTTQQPNQQPAQSPKNPSSNEEFRDTDTQTGEAG